MDSLIAREGNSLPSRLRMWADPRNFPGLHSTEGDVVRYDMRTAADEIERLYSMLTECANRFERCCRAAGNDAQTAADAVEKYRFASAGRGVEQE